jgi:hypothetical protein
MLLMMIGTILTRVVHHLKSKTQRISAGEELVEFAATYIVYTILFLILYSVLICIL